jgi:hypothetical protein
MKINFNCYDMGVGGGNRTILQLANGLVDKGYDVTLTVYGKLSDEHKWFKEGIRGKINYIFPSLLQRAFRRYVLSGGYFANYDIAEAMIKAIPDCDINVATYCFTAYPTYFSGKGSPFYLVQNYEPWFFNDKTSQLKAEMTYSMPLHKLVVSKWLQEKVGGTWIGNGVDLKVFQPRKKPDKKPPYRIMAFIRGMERKGDKEILQAYNILKEHLPCELVTPRNVTDEELAELYSSCHVVLFPSQYEGIGLVGLEGMGCATPVIVTNCLGINEYARHLQNAYVVPRRDDSTVQAGVLAGAIREVLLTDDLANQLVQGGLKTAKEYDFEKVVDRVEKAFMGS